MRKLRVKYENYVEESYDDWATYSDYKIKFFKTKEEENEYIKELKQKEKELSRDGWVVAYFVKREEDKSYKRV